MRSASDDATTRSRIRDAAIRLFGRAGFDKVTVREIASEAGVSAALVIHHFGSKEQLRAACDAYIVDEVIDRKEAIGQGDLLGAMEQWLSDMDTYRPSFDYLARMLTDNSGAGDQLFDDLVVRTEGILTDGAASGVMRESSDSRVTAVVLAAQGIMPLILERHLARALGEQGLSDTLIRRLTLPLLELYTHGLYATDAVLEAAREALARTAGPESHKGPGDPNQDPDPPRG